MHEELVQILRDCRKPPYAGDTTCKKCPFLYGSADGSEICLDRLIGAAADAIEELQQTVEHYKGCSDDWYKEACDYKAMLPRWIPVTDRLPEEHEWVLCKCRAKIREVLSLRDGYWYHDPQHQYMSGFVTHWMPLPEPPKEET